MSEPLQTAWAKAKRALYHLNCLEKILAPFRASGYGYRITRQFESESQKHIFRAYLLQNFPEEDAGIFVGDCVHNARTSLDYIAWQLAEAGKGGDKYTGFPICAVEEAFLDPKGGRRAVRQMTRRAQEMVGRLQPYRRDDPLSDPLWVLHTLDVADKHKLLTVTAQVVQDSVYQYGHGVKGEMQLRPSPFMDGDIIAEVKILYRPPGVQPEEDVQTDFAFEVAFGQRSLPIGFQATMVPSLDYALHHLEKIVALFDKHLRRTPPF